MSGRDEPDGNLIDLVPRLRRMADDDGAPPPIVHQRASPCQFHYDHTALIDVRGRKLTCSGCGADLDPYEYIGFLARDGTRLIETRKRYQSLAKKLEQLLAEEKRAKARVRHWRKREGEIGT